MKQGQDGETGSSTKEQMDEYEALIAAHRRVKTVYK